MKNEKLLDNNYYEQHMHTVALPINASRWWNFICVAYCCCRCPYDALFGTMTEGCWTLIALPP